MAIRFECPVCSNHLSAKSDYAGKEGKCKCGTAVIVPGHSEKMKFACIHCRKGISVSNRHAGKKTRCPTCKDIITVPLLGNLILPELELEVLPDVPESPPPAPAQAREIGIDTTPRVDVQTVLSNDTAKQRMRENRLLRIYWILSFIALIGPACYLLGFLMIVMIFGGVAVPGTIGIVYVLGFLVRYFPLILSPVAIIAALAMKFRYDIEMIWPLKTAILAYAIYLYNLIENQLLF